MHSACQSPPPLEVTVTEVKLRLDRGDSVVLLDVREPEEHAIARLQGAELIPMGTVPANAARLERISDERETLIVFCHHGVRSLHVAEWLRRHGIENTQSMEGGIDAWSRLIDPAVPRY